MPKNVTIKQGDCINSIAFAEGVVPKKIWDDGNNKGLRDRRTDQNILMPDDVVRIPDKTVKEEAKAVDKIHEFRLLNGMVKLHLTLLYYDEPIKKQPYLLKTDGKRQYKGETKDDGKIEVTIPAKAKTATLTVGKDEDKLEYTLDLGHLDPVDEVTGFKKRLKNLGFGILKTDGTEGEDYENAVKLFESENQLDNTGKSDVRNQSKLKETYGR